MPLFTQNGRYYGQGVVNFLIQQLAAESILKDSWKSKYQSFLEHSEKRNELTNQIIKELRQDLEVAEERLENQKNKSIFQLIVEKIKGETFDE